VIPLLQAKGFNVVAVQNPLTSLADDVAATKRAIALQNGPVLLVGHSYGGVAGILMWIQRRRLLDEELRNSRFRDTSTTAAGRAK
jgi:pimeloyl-ACP methyl ester carboxylesterase